MSSALPPQITIAANAELVAALNKALAGDPLTDDERIELQCLELQARVARFNARPRNQETADAQHG